jgi:hypothetical protein
MRILFLNDLCDPRIGSSIRQMYQHAELLRAQGHATALVTCTQERGEVGETVIEGMQVFRLFSDYNVRFRGWRSLDNPAVGGPRAGGRAPWEPAVVPTHHQATHHR